MRLSIFVTILTVVFVVIASVFYSQDEYARANYWLLITLLLETCAVRISGK